MAQAVAGVRPTLSPLVYLRRTSAGQPDPLGAKDCRIYARARNGLCEGLLALGVGAGHRVLLPSWHHGSEVEAVRATGAECVFYPLGPDLEPEPEALESMVMPGVSALHLTHFLGFPQDAARWRAWCDQRGLLLVEDAAQAYLASRDGVPVGAHGDLAVCCLYKTFGLADGAFVRGPAPPPPPEDGLGLRGLAARHQRWLAQWLPVGTERGLLGRGRGADPLDATGYDPADDFALGPPSGPSVTTRWLLPRVLAEDVAGRRRDIYRRYLKVLSAHAPRPFRTLPRGAVPFAFPLAVPDKPAALAVLRAHGVQAGNLWSVPHPLLPQGLDPRADWLRAHVLALPAHQGLGPRWVRRIEGAACAVVNAARDSEPDFWGVFA